MSLRAASIQLVFLLLIPMMVISQERNKTISDPQYGHEILIGYCDRSALEKGEYGKWFSENYDAYIPDKNIINELKQKQAGIEIFIILGTWCSDSREQVPRFFNILDKIRFDKKSVQMVAVDSNKEAGDIDLKIYDITKVPTFIIYRKGREIGRIIEKPFMTLEKDLLMFFSEN
jgi:thiol-disulfide isomerase/thioredoxin